MQNFSVGSTKNAFLRGFQAVFWVIFLKLARFYARTRVLLRGKKTKINKYIKNNTYDFILWCRQWYGNSC